MNVITDILSAQFPESFVSCMTCLNTGENQCFGKCSVCGGL